MLFRPAESSKNIVQFYKDYLITTFQTNNKEYNRQLKEAVNENGVISVGPYISLSDMFEKGKTLRQLANSGELSPLICDYKNLEPDRNLYLHQESSILQFNNGKNLIVTTGTGSGKTECFMIPLLNSLLREKENGTLNSGVRALLVYPMNALVNDQIRRLRELFEGTDTNITFGRFTSETKESYSEALKLYQSREGHNPQPNELISRKQMRETPPNILITNYAMLEYLLLRPGDNVFFSEDNAKKWKTIVFDEAHTYEGAKGIEVATLIRRLKARLNRNDIQFILTSATLGDENLNSEIINFAESLCGAEFDKCSIIRSKTVDPKAADSRINVPKVIYKDLANFIRNNDSSQIILKYLREKDIKIINAEESEDSVNKTLYEMIRQDNFYHELRKILLNKTKPLDKIANQLNVSQNDLTNFIAVASNAKINNDKFFEARYHLFIRGMEGVFVTLKPSNKLFIKKMETYRSNPEDEDTEFKCFEISFCHNCNAIYISGQVNEDGYLIQKSKHLDDYTPEVYLLDGEYDPSEDENFEDECEYLICSKCGKIKRTSSLSELDCGHSKDNYNKLIKVKEAGQELHQCPCCHITNTQRSIVRPYFLGSESATSVIATALYNELPNQEIRKVTEINNDPFFGETINETEETKHLSKQFLAFSDNRQAAAFFASYLESTYHELLMRRLMAEVVLKNHSFNSGVSLPSFVEKLIAEMNENQVFGSEDEREKEAWISVTKELINQKARNSLQNEGILYFDYRGLDYHENPNLGMTEENVNNLFRVFIGQFLKKGAINLPITLLKHDRRKLNHSGLDLGFVLEPTKAKYVEGWLPRQDKENNRTKILLKFFPDKDLKWRTDFLKSIWDQLVNKNIIIFYTPKKGVRRFVVNSECITVKSISNLYFCPECNNRYTYSINGICPNPNCKGILQEFVRENADNDPYYKIYRELHMDDLIAKEHTAQLGIDKSTDYQNKFKDKKINVLSCSTTFEMGVDVGSLQTVFMRNMPPTPANYAQRAGRAGRSLNSAAYSITFCANNSHDLTFFRNPETMIKGTVNPPSFNVDNEKIILRHIYASAFSAFWKENPCFFKRTIGEFIDSGGYTEFRKYLHSNPNDLKNYLLKVVPYDLQKLFGIKDFKWIDLLFSDDVNTPGTFVIAYNKYINQINSLTSARELNQAEIKDNFSNDLYIKGISISKSIKTLKNQKLIEFLSRNNLIPKYGFPVDTVELQTLGNNEELESLRLDRDLFSAISEYAPDSEVVADGKLIKSRYLKTLSEYEWPKYNFVECENCHTLNRSLWTEYPDICRQCSEPLPTDKYRQYIVPKFGFIMDNEEPKPVNTDKPERTYKGAISYIGNDNDITFHDYIICDKTVQVGTSKMDELCVINNSDFYICPSCGYGKIIETNGIKKNEEIFIHKKPDGYLCKNDKLISYALGHDFQTDVCLIRFVDENISNIEQAWTILYSLLEGLSKYLNIERTELSGCLHWYKNNNFNRGNYSFVLFDNTPGGAGYVRQLQNSKCFIGMLNKADYVVNSCSCGGEAKDTACYGCLCNYYNQKQHDILKRYYAIDFFESMRNGKNQWDCIII